MNKETSHLMTIDSLLPRGTVVEDPCGRGVYFAFPSDPDPRYKTALDWFQEVKALDEFCEQHPKEVGMVPAPCRLFNSAFDEWVDRGCQHETIFIPDSRDHDEWASRFAAAQNAATAILQVRTRSHRTDPDLDEENDAAIAVLEDSGYAGFMDLLSLAREIADEREEGIY